MRIGPTLRGVGLAIYSKEVAVVAVILDPVRAVGPPAKLIAAMRNGEGDCTWLGTPVPRGTGRFDG
jgi:hypothetical protein